MLAEIDPATYQAQLDQAVAKKAQDEAQLANAQQRPRALRRSSRASNADHKQQVDTQRALVAQLEAQIKPTRPPSTTPRPILDYTTIVAPIDGRTGIRMVDEGNMVRAIDANPASW